MQVPEVSLLQLLPKALREAAYVQRLGQLLAFMAAQAAGVPHGAHAAFAQYGIDAVSVTVKRGEV